MFRLQTYGNDDRRAAEDAKELYVSRFPERGIRGKSPSSILNVYVFFQTIVLHVALHVLFILSLRKGLSVCPFARLPVCPFAGWPVSPLAGLAGLSGPQVICRLPVVSMPNPAAASSSH
ncbi:hypothetical protein D3OALGA1CA_81 [Olavius algarvensis associated proteobacterium Delta 3]|nr:hypothetical protein D3OALGA1CA_81 [Olavius algarvensis associated proteobacterium Delta 3]